MDSSGSKGSGSEEPPPELPSTSEGAQGPGSEEPPTNLDSTSKGTQGSGSEESLNLPSTSKAARGIVNGTKEVPAQGPMEQKAPLPGTLAQDFDDVKWWINLSKEREDTHPLNETEQYMGHTTWSRIHDQLRTNPSYCYLFGQEVLHLAVDTMDRAFLNMKKLGNFPRPGVTDVNVVTAALQSTGVVVQFVNEGLKKEELSFNEKDGAMFNVEFQRLLNVILRHVLTADNSIACGMMDVLGFVGDELYTRLKEKDQRHLLVFVLGYADTANPKRFPSLLRAKFGRCLAKMIQYESLQDDVFLFLDVFHLIQNHIDKGEGVMKLSYAWLLGNLTDNLVTIYMNREEQLVKFAPTFVTDLLETAVKSMQVPLRGRYSACRSCGNVFTWLKAAMLQCEATKFFIKRITDSLVAMIGSGVDYKLRWNAAHAVGHALKNDIFYNMMPQAVTVPILKSLGKWIAQSQNYKERIQCAGSLIKVQSRACYGSQYGYIWERISLSMTRLPVDDDCESTEKFKVESILLMFHMMKLVEAEDLVALEPILSANFENLKHVVSDNAANIPLDRLADVLCAKERLLEFGRQAVEGSKTSVTVKLLLQLLRLVAKDDTGSGLN